MRSDKIVGYWFICDKCKEPSKTSAYNFKEKKTRLCRKCVSSKTTKELVKTNCDDCGMEFEYIYRGKAKSHYCDDCIEKHRQKSNKLFKKMYDKRHILMFTQLGTLNVSKRSIDFDVELKRIKRMKSKWMGKRKNPLKINLIINDISHVLGVKYGDMFRWLEQGDWFFDEDIFDFVTEDVDEWLHGTKPEFYG